MAYNKISATIVQLKLIALIAKAVNPQNKNGFAIRVTRMIANNDGTDNNEPNAQTSGSAYGMTVLRLINLKF